MGIEEGNGEEIPSRVSGHEFLVRAVSMVIFLQLCAVAGVQASSEGKFNITQCWVDLVKT
jgi:hypothetical protein